MSLRYYCLPISLVRAGRVAQPFDLAGITDTGGMGRDAGSLDKIGSLLSQIQRPGPPLSPGECASCA